MDSLVEELEAFIHRDPAMRGLISSEAKFGRLCPGHFSAAAHSLSQPNLQVALVTGFYIPKADPPAAETDGPPGTIRLALMLKALGHRVAILTDPWCAPAIGIAAELMGFSPDHVLTVPAPPLDDEWNREFFANGFGRDMTHLIAVERVGPSHTWESIRQQGGPDDEALEKFRAEVPANSWGRCHNMRGEPIDDWTGNLHKLFEWSNDYRPDVCTMAIGDGGNEIGMGCLKWADVARRLLGPMATLIPCRIATDWNIIAGTSNWGGYALSAAVASLTNRLDILEPWTCVQEEQILKEFVAHGPAVDGATRLREATVDGLPFLTYIQAWAGIRRRLGLDE